MLSNHTKRVQDLIRADIVATAESIKMQMLMLFPDERWDWVKERADRYGISVDEYMSIVMPDVTPEQMANIFGAKQKA